MARVWASADPQSETSRTSDALDEPTTHRIVHTRGGDYWVCAHTGQLERTEVEHTLVTEYDAHWQTQIDRQMPDDRMYRTADRMLAGLERHHKPGKLFEVACGLGSVLKAAQKRGWEADGIELSPVAARFAEQLIGQPIRVGAVEDAGLTPASYDLIIMDNIFEHLFHPRRVMLALAQALRPGGVMFVQTLNAQAYSLRAQPTQWNYYGSGHLFIPTRTSFAHYLRHCGLETVWLRTKGYRPRPDRDEREISRLSRLNEKCISNIARWTRHGHRIQCVLRKPA